jgi:hypothetical protein
VSDLPARGKPQVIGTDPEARGRAQIHVQLAPPPGEEWQAMLADSGVT